jgi:hypothetical protein
MRAVVDYQRPPKLYRFAPRALLERSLTLGEFRLVPSVPDYTLHTDLSNQQILPFKSRNPMPASAANYLTLSLTTACDEKMFDTTPGADCCLIIHEPEEFGERIHRAVRTLLPNWAGIDAAVSYGAPSPLGAAFSKNKTDSFQKEWLFAWRPVQTLSSMHPVVIDIGSIERIAELRHCAIGSNS